MKIVLFAEDPSTIDTLVYFYINVKKKNKDITYLTTENGKNYRSDFSEFLVINNQNQIKKHLENSELVVIGSSENFNSFGNEIIKTCLEKKILSIGIVDRGLSVTKRYKFNYNTNNYIFPNYILTPEVQVKKELTEMGLKDTKIKIIQDSNIAKFRNENGYLLSKYNNLNSKLKYKNKTWLFLAESKSLLEPETSVVNENYFFKGSGVFKYRDAIVLEELIKIKQSLSYKVDIILRLHPKNNRKDFYGLLGKVKKVSQYEDPLELLIKSDIVIGMTTNLLVQSCLLNKPTLSIIVEDDYEKYIPEEIVGKIKVIKNVKELQKVLFSTNFDWKINNNIWFGKGENILNVVNKIVSESFNV